MKFKEWIFTRRVTNSARGDFIRDARQDKNFPDLDSAKEYVGYLHSKRACREAVSEFKKLWAAYEKEMNA